MSEIRWCDAGGHPFSLNDPGRREFAETKIEADGTRRRIDVCGPCDEGNAFQLHSFASPVAKAVGNSDGGSNAGATGEEKTKVG